MHSPDVCVHSRWRCTRCGRAAAFFVAALRVSCSPALSLLQRGQCKCVHKQTCCYRSSPPLSLSRIGADFYRRGDSRGKFIKSPPLPSVSTQPEHAFTRIRKELSFLEMFFKSSEHTLKNRGRIWETKKFEKLGSSPSFFIPLSIRFISISKAQCALCISYVRVLKQLPTSSGPISKIFKPKIVSTSGIGRFTDFLFLFNEML